MSKKSKKTPKEESAEWLRNVAVEVRPEYYNVSLPPEWAKRFLQVAEGVPAYHGHANDLVLNLRTAEIVARLPYYLLDGMYKFVSAFLLGKQASATTEKMVNYVAGRICTAVHENPRDSSFTGEQMETIRDECISLKGDFYDVATKADVEYLKTFPTELWDRYLGDPGFRVGMWGSQRSAYVSAYNYYEAFLVQCLAVKRAQKSLRIKGERAMRDALTQEWDSSVAANCFDTHELKVARYLRHSLSHNGGKESDELRNNLDGKPHGIEVADDDKMLQVMPQDVVLLLSVIAAGASRLLGAISQPSAGR